jgi:hypothetical protein
MSVTFDTLEVSKRLKSAGFDDAQAEAITGVLRESRGADLSRLATKDDLSRVESSLRAELEIARRDLTIRLVGMIVVGTGILLAAKFFG